MNLLILGGPRFLGRHLIDAALADNHDVTLFNRGQTNPQAYPEVEKLRGDRDGDLTALHGRRWDAVIDTCGYVPRLVHDSAQLLADNVGHYTFVSSISVYPDTSQPGLDESAPLGTLEDETVEEITGETYGPLKVLCEQAVDRHFPGRALHVRAGLIVGPHDVSDRFTYWPARFARGGEVLAPGNPQEPVQFIDVRDLAAWMIRMAVAGETGPFNVTGPQQELSMGALLESCQRVARVDSTITWVPDAFLLAQEVEPWMGLPLWIPAAHEMAPGFSRINCARAFATGLACRPVVETVRDTLHWAQTRPSDHAWRAGVSGEKETAVLKAWRTEQE